MALVVGLFVNLGLWQVRRHGERQTENAVGSARIAAPVSDLDVLLAAVGDDIDSLEWRAVTVEGTYRPEWEVLVRSAVVDGRAGFAVVTPLQTVDDQIVLVNRGWVPLEFDEPPVPASPPEGRVEVAGRLRLPQTRPVVGAEDAEPPNRVVSRVDPDWFEALIGRMPVPMWVQASGREDRLPIPLDVPTFDDPGPHIAYAVQWFSFAAIAIVGFALLIRSTAHRRGVR